MSIMTRPQTDSQGYTIPWTADDETIECGPDDADWGDPESWPEWTDRWVFEEGPAIEAPPFEPHPDDEEWLARHWLTDAELEDMARDAAFLDHIESLARFNEADARAAGLAVG